MVEVGKVYLYNNRKVVVVEGDAFDGIWTVEYVDSGDVVYGVMSSNLKRIPTGQKEGSH